MKSSSLMLRVEQSDEDVPLAMSNKESRNGENVASSAGGDGGWGAVSGGGNPFG